MSLTHRTSVRLWSTPRTGVPTLPSVLLFACCFTGLTLAVQAAETSSDANPWRVEAVRDCFAQVHALIDAQVEQGVANEAIVRSELMRVVRSVLASGVPRAQADAINEALDVANRLDSRQHVLQALSALGYGLDLSGSAEADLTPLLFTLGNLEKANGDFQAAQMWFDSTAALRHGKHTALYVAAAAKLNGCIDRDEGRHQAALPKIRLAKRVLDTVDAPAFEYLHLNSVLALALAIVNAGADTSEAVILGRQAYEGMASDAEVRNSWTYSYLIYLNYAEVLRAIGQPREGLSVLEEGLALTLDRRDRPSQSYIYLRLAKYQLALKDYSGAERSALKALEIFEELQHESHLAEVHGYLKDIYATSPATLRKSLYHASEAHRIELNLMEAERAESLLALQNDYRRTNAEQKTLIAEQNAERAELEHDRVVAQRTSILTAMLLACGLLAFVINRLRNRRRYSDQLETVVQQRTAQLAARTEQLEQRTRKLQASNQELERFAFIASHDLKTPLRNVTSFLGLIERRMPAEARPVLGEYVELATSYARKMHVLVTDVLEFSRLNDEVEGMAAQFELRDLCLELADEFSATRDDVAITVLGSGRTIAPQVFVRQIFSNLIENGLKYNESLVKRISIEIAADATGNTIRVTDNGIGIDEQYHDYVFELFRRLHTDDTYTGTGLGLATCTKLIERMGGTVSLTSVVGQGSTFEVAIPTAVAVPQGDSCELKQPLKAVMSS